MELVLWSVCCLLQCGCPQNSKILADCILSLLYKWISASFYVWSSTELYKRLKNIERLACRYFVQSNIFSYWNVFTKRCLPLNKRPLWVKMLCSVVGWKVKTYDRGGLLWRSEFESRWSFQFFLLNLALKRTKIRKKRLRLAHKK